MSNRFEQDDITRDEKVYDDVSEEDLRDEKVKDTPGHWTPPEAWLIRFVDGYQGQHGGETLPPGSDPERVAEAVFTMDVSESVERLKIIAAEALYDYTFDQQLLAYIRDLLLGAEHCGMDQENWSYEVCRLAGVIHNWSAYAEVRAVLLPYDDPEIPCESVRVYVLGFFWIAVVTFVGTFFSQRQPGISIPQQFAQLLLVPMGRGLAYIVPDWGVTIRGKRYSLNTGPWSPKEQLLSTIMMSQSSTIGNTTGILDLRMPIFFGQKWATLGYSILLAIANQCFGLGMAGILRRLTVYPTWAVWPSNLPLLAYNRTLTAGDNKGEVVNGWKITRWQMFLISTAVFIVWYWIPNDFFQAIRYFNWMTWIAPNNLKLAIVTGSWGGMGINPISCLDPNTSGSGTMNAPFFAVLQQYTLQFFSGIVLLILYFKNVSWAAYMPINSNASFDNQMNSYNLTRILNSDNTLNLDAYLDYSPPYYAIGYLYSQGAQFVYFTFSMVYIFIRYWKIIKKAFGSLIQNNFKGRSIYTGFDDGHCNLMRKYPEVPEWWYMIVLAIGFAISIVTVSAYPTQTPWWTIVALAVIGTFVTIPWCVIKSLSNVGLPLGIIWNVLPGVWFPGKFLPDLMLLMLGDAFTDIAGSFGTDLKYAHYARIPPRAIFRTHIASQVLNCVIYCCTIEALLGLYDSDNTFCHPDNKNFMVCNGPRGVYSSVISYGVLGTNNLFKLYPALKWCFLIGPILALVWSFSEIVTRRIRARIVSGMDEEQRARFDRKYWNPLSTVVASVHPAIALEGATNWGGNTNLTQYTTALFLSWLFQYFLKRRYTAWWGKYAFLLFSGLNVGIAISGFISTLIFSFGAGKGTDVFNYGVNRISTSGVDYKLYENKASLLPLPDQGFFGLAKGDYPVANL